MALTMDEMQERLNELLGEETPSRSRLTDIASEIRDNYHEVYGTNETLSRDIEVQNQNYNEVVLTNAKLFRQLSAQKQGKDKTEEQEKLNKSETITIEELEKGATQS